MSTRGELETRVSAARPDPSDRLKRWAARRARQLLRVSLAVSGVLVLVAAAALLRRATCLIGLPDVGDPFDVTAVSAERIPDDRNAFVYFQQAAARLRPPLEVPDRVLAAGPSVGWSKADPRVREWAESNREALDLFRRAAEQADGRAHPAAGETTFAHDRMALHRFAQLAILEASRLEERGDMPGAWAWYRAFLGMHAHIMRRGTGFERHVANFSGGVLQQRCALWAADPRTGPIDLRRALDDVVALGPRAEWEASALKVDYLLAMRELDRPEQVLNQGDSEEQKYKIGGETLPPNLAQSVYAIRRFLIREPERSRRVLRLAFANWLAHVEVPGERRRKPAVRARLGSYPSNPGVFFYAAGPAAPAAARALSPQALAEWSLTAPDAKLIQDQELWPSIGRQERQQHRALLILLADELYRREHGRPPASENDLVGTYLEHLPDGGSDDLGDGTTPTVEDPRSVRPGSDP